MTRVAKTFDAASLVSNIVSKINPQEVIENGVFDTLLFSDRYRRGAFFFGGERNGLLSEVAELTRKLGIASTYYYTDNNYKASDAVNKDAMSRVMRSIKDIDWRVAELGAAKIILPFGGRGNIFAAHLKDALKEQEFKTSVEVRGREYNLNLSALGPVQKDKPTILDEGIRGVCHYKQGLRHQWDRKVA